MGTLFPCTSLPALVAQNPRSTRLVEDLSRRMPCKLLNLIVASVSVAETLRFRDEEGLPSGYWVMSVQKAGPCSAWFLTPFSLGLFNPSFKSKITRTRNAASCNFFPFLKWWPPFLFLSEQVSRLRFVCFRQNVPCKKRETSKNKWHTVPFFWLACCFSECFSFRQKQTKGLSKLFSRNKTQI